MKFDFLWLNSIFLLLGVLSSPAFAGVKNVCQAPVLISGTLKPMTLAVNGQKILNLESEDTSIFINGHEVMSEKQDSHRTIFYKITESHLEIKDSHQKILVTMELPSLQKFESKKNNFLATVFPANSLLKLDDEVVPGDSEDRSVFVTTDEHSPWFQNDHTLTVMDPATKVERVYVIEVFYDIPNRRIQRLGLEIGDTPISDPNLQFGVGAFYDYIFANHFLVGGRISLPWPKSRFYEPQDGYILQVRTGYQIFRKSNALHSAVWLEAGAGIENVSYQEYNNSSSGPQTFNKAVPFFYLYTQPLVIDKIQLGFSMQGGPRAAQGVPNFINTLMAIYEW